MANDSRLDRLARIYGTSSTSERAKIAELFKGLTQMERDEPWPQGTAAAILAALLEDSSHTFTAIDGEGNRTVYRIGPFHRDERGAVRWDWAVPVLTRRLEYTPAQGQ